MNQILVKTYKTLNFNLGQTKFSIVTRLHSHVNLLTLIFPRTKVNIFGDGFKIWLQDHILIEKAV